MAAHLADGDPSLARLDRLVEEVTKAPLTRQHAITAEVFTLISRLPGSEGIGFRLGASVPMSAFEVGTRLAPTVRDLLRLVSRFHHLSIPLMLYRFVERRGGGELSIGFRHPVDPACEALLISGVVSLIDRELALLTGRSGNIARIELTSSSEPLLAEYRSFCACAVEARHPANTVFFEPAVLDLPNRVGDAETFRSLWSAYEELERANALAPDPRTKARDLLMANPTAPPTLEEIARAVGMSVRQLRLALGRAGTTYRGILKECRVAHARTMFANPSVTVSEVAFRLGYSDVAAFTHGLKRWTGMSPKAFRKTLRDD